MKLVCAISVCVLALVAIQAETPQDNKREVRAIQQVLADQMKAWNRGDIPGFMDGYVRSSKLRFASGGSFRFGWETTLKRYQTTYATPEAMGRLTFSDLKVHVLSEKWAEVFGRWELKRGGEFEDIGGLFTLLMQKTDQGWKVLHDHTSSRPKPEK